MNALLHLRGGYRWLETLHYSARCSARMSLGPELRSYYNVSVTAVAYGAISDCEYQYSAFALSEYALFCLLGVLLLGVYAATSDTLASHSRRGASASS